MLGQTTIENITTLQPYGIGPLETTNLVVHGFRCTPLWFDQTLGGSSTHGGRRCGSRELSTNRPPCSILKNLNTKHSFVTPFQEPILRVAAFQRVANHLSRNYCGWIRFLRTSGQRLLWGESDLHTTRFDHTKPCFVRFTLLFSSNSKHKFSNKSTLTSNFAAIRPNISHMG